jgi:hypothetical protein
MFKAFKSKAFISKSLIRPVLLLVFALLPSGIVRAADRDTCIAYAGQATSKAVEDAMAVCGYSGDAWNPGDFIGHLNWCLGASAQTVKAEQDSRQAALNKCDKCKTYASQAVAAQTMNDPDETLKTTYAPQGVKGNPFPLPPMACGYSGDAWSSNFNAHARWCAGVSEDDARRETEKRNGLITICEGCRNYAHRAVASYLAIWPKCRHFWANPSMSDPRWSTDHRNHFQWCMSLPNHSRFSRADNEHRARDLVIEACNASQSKAPLTIQTPTSVEAVKKGPAKRATKRDTGSSTATAVDARKPSSDAVKASTKKQSGGSSSSAMDRLGGGSSSPSGGAGSGGAGSAAAKARSGAGEAAPSSSGGGGGSGAAVPATMLNRNTVAPGGPPERLR